MARLISRNMTETDSPVEVNSALLLALVSTASLCVGQTLGSPSQLSGEIGPGLFLLLGRIRWTDQLRGIELMRQKGIERDLGWEGEKPSKYWDTDSSLMECA